jgi:hypothetical protein
MPATKAKKSVPAKKAPVKKAVARPAAPARVRAPRKDEDIWSKQFFLKEQEEFHTAHPNSKVLIALFTGALALFLYIVWSNKLDLFPQAFVW